MIENRLPGFVENDVLFGHDGYLFLAGGAHQSLAYARGERIPSQTSRNNFRQNLERRSDFAHRHKAQYLHIIYPDKHNILFEQWPFLERISIYESYFASEVTKACDVLYPRELLQIQDQQTASRVDTHMTAYGNICVAVDVVERLTRISQHAVAEQHILPLLTSQDITGDLGAKLSPPISASEDTLTDHLPGPLISNRLAGANNGITDLRFNFNASVKERVAIFGDSYGRELARCLQYWFKEVFFFRSPHLHEEIVTLCRPDVVITESAERYLDLIGPDEERLNFFMYPHVKGVPYNPSKQFAEAMSAVLSRDGKSYSRFISGLSQL